MPKLTITAEDLGLTDEETTVFRIGKHDYRLAPMRFATVKRAFPALEGFMGLDRTNPTIMFDAVSSIMGVIALGIIQTRREAIRYAEETSGAEAAAAVDERLAKLPEAQGERAAFQVLADELEEDIYPAEVEAIHDAVFMLIARSGMNLGGAEGPAPEAEAPDPSTETSTPSSPNSSQEAAEPGAK